MQTRKEELTSIWARFESAIVELKPVELTNLSDIKKLMVSEFVVDISTHEIYTHTSYVHQLTRQLLTLKNPLTDNPSIIKACECWLEVLRIRNRYPLQVFHHNRLDGECNFQFSLQMMEEKPSEFAEIQIIKQGNSSPFLLQATHKLDCLAFGMSFGKLPIVDNQVLSSLIEFKDTIFLAAKDQNGNQIGHMWGIMLRNVEIGKQHKANIFWWMEIARDPDFHGDNISVGAALRSKMFELLQSRNDWDFIGYQHVLNHKFHMGIVSHQDDNEFVVCNNEKHEAKSSLKFDDDISYHIRVQFIKSNHSSLPFPEYSSIRPAILKTFWQAKRSAYDFIFGGISFFRRTNNQKSQNRLESHHDHRLNEKTTQEKDACDLSLLKKIILNDNSFVKKRFIQQERIFPAIVKEWIKCANKDYFNYLDLKACTVKTEKSPTHHSAIELLHYAISMAGTPTLAIDILLRSKSISDEWLNMINHDRNMLINRGHHEANSLSIHPN